MPTSPSWKPSASTNKENEKAGIKADDARLPDQGLRGALKKFPDFNSSLDGEELVLKSYYHIGFAADTPNGLVVPVIKDADKKGVLQIAPGNGRAGEEGARRQAQPCRHVRRHFHDLFARRDRRQYFTPIINAPEVAILGVCKSQTEPVWDGKQFQPRLMLPLSLSWDHRVIDGASAARFNAYLGQILADFRRVLL